jgi:hypothetical protein
LTKKNRKFSVSDYNKSRDDYTQSWKAIDETFYRLCRDHPRHNERPWVNAKILIIGRTYATGIERKVPTTGAQGSSISQVATFFFTRREELDQWFARLTKVSEPLTTSNVQEILTVHGLILERLKEITRNRQVARSFVSKYLHFHNPAVPIYDSVASASLRNLVPLRSIRGFQIAPAEHADSEYADYVRRFTSLYQHIAAQGLAVTVRALDSYLIWNG